MAHPTPPKTSVRRRPTTAAALLLAGVAAGCSAEPTPFHQNPVGVLRQNSLARGWFIDLNLAGPDRQPVAVDVRSKLLYVYTADKHVTAVDRKTGVVQYTAEVRSPESRLEPLVELEGYVVFPNATNLQVFDDRGRFLKAVDVPTPLRSRAAAESSEAPGTNRGTTLYFGASGIGHGGLVEAYDVSRHDAYKKWEYITHLQGAIVAAPAVYGGLIYSGDDRGEVDAVNTGRLQVWATDHADFLTSGAITADLRADESGLYVASNDSKLYCISLTTGKLQWQYFAGAELTDSPVLTADTVYQMTPNHGLVALDKTAGAATTALDAPPAKAYNRHERWTCPDATQFLAQDARFTYVAETRPNRTPELPPERFIVALDKQTGRPAFESEHHDFVLFGTNPRDATVYVAFADGKVMSLDPVLRAGQIGELVMVPVTHDAVASAR